MSDDWREEILKPDRIGSMDPEIIHWKPPSRHKKQVMRRIFQMQLWIQEEIKHRFVGDEEIVQYAMRHFGIERQQALEYTKECIKEMKDKGVLVIHA